MIFSMWLNNFLEGLNWFNNKESKFFTTSNLSEAKVKIQKCMEVFLKNGFNFLKFFQS